MLPYLNYFVQLHDTLDGTSRVARFHTAAPRNLSMSQRFKQLHRAATAVWQFDRHSAHTFIPGNLEIEDIDHVYSGNLLRVKIQTPDQS